MRFLWENPASFKPQLTNSANNVTFNNKQQSFGPPEKAVPGKNGWNLAGTQQMLRTNHKMVWAGRFYCRALTALCGCTESTE
jgi:hypothetical protein